MFSQNHACKRLYNQRKRRCRKSLISALSLISWVSLISGKIRKNGVKKQETGKGSKECACNTCTSCEGAAPPSTPQRLTDFLRGGSNG